MLTDRERKEMFDKLYEDDMERQFIATESFQNAYDKKCVRCGERMGDHAGFKCPKDFEA